MSDNARHAAEDRVVPEQVAALWAIREGLQPDMTPEEAQLLRALRAALEEVATLRAASAGPGGAQF